MREAALAIECTRVTDPGELWDALAIALGLPDDPRRDLAAIRDALARGGPEWPQHVVIDVHAVEQLEARGLHGLLHGLEQLAAELAVARRPPARLRVHRSRPAPRGRVYQHDGLYSRQLEGLPIARACGWRGHPGDRDAVGLLWLAPVGRGWIRLFVDAGFAVWEEWPDEVIARELAEVAEAGELIELPALTGERLGAVRFEVVSGWIPEIRIELGSGRTLRLSPRDPSDDETTTALTLS